LQGNFEPVKLVLERLKNKVGALGKLAVERHETDSISGQVDAAASSMVQKKRPSATWNQSRTEFRRRACPADVPTGNDLAKSGVT
jgi:hypothetical protein